MQKKIILSAISIAAVSAAAAVANTVHFDIYTDDYGQYYVDGNLVGSYNNPAAAGNITPTLNLVPGWHNVSFDYKNQFGTNFLAFRWQFTGDPNISNIPLADYRSLNASNTYGPGLRADYYDTIGNFQFTVYGEGPIDNGALSFTSEIYEGNPGLWAGVYGPSALFEERLSGQIFIPGTPEPSSFVFLSITACSFLCYKRYRRKTRH